ncbi:V-set and immunoglobulin domain-containing protein 1 [Labeo rohita]|nr:V-set and immunoglobulin domain-containing protein 1 [Labeo rohita]
MKHGNTTCVIGVDAVLSVSVMKGKSVTLNDTDIQRNDEIEWRFKEILIADINIKTNISMFYDNSADGRFRDRLKLDQTGSLTITNTRTTDSGLYTSSRTNPKQKLNTFNLTVYDANVMTEISLAPESAHDQGWTGNLAYPVGRSSACSSYQQHLFTKFIIIRIISIEMYAAVLIFNMFYTKS